jgi:hypothetical protein
VAIKSSMVEIAICCDVLGCSFKARPIAWMLWTSLQGSIHGVAKKELPNTERERNRVSGLSLRASRSLGCRVSGPSLRASRSLGCGSREPTFPT